jgi:hypothetical protein
MSVRRLSKRVAAPVCRFNLAFDDMRQRGFTNARR